jgi:D-alanyl-D-alanine carboxypeptidase/D-alanyl-D-alanine-endopeptidase (penicillin-binding protein 4)
MIKKLLIILIAFSTLTLAISKEELVNKIRLILSSLPNGTTTGIVIYNPLNQDTIFVMNEKIPMIPASLTKLFTTATSLNVMNSNHKLSTKLFTNDLNLKDGIINGNIYIKGFGNSLFTENDLRDFVNKLSEMNLKEITGDVIGDDTYIDNIYTREDWIENEKANVRLPAISALVLDRNTTTVKKKVKRRFRYISENIKDPPLFIATRLKELLKAAGIKVNGNANKGNTPSNTYALTEKFTELKDLISLINKHSDNFLAECLFKTLGAEASGLQGNSYFSQQAIQKFLKENNIYTAGTEIVDGSGISRFDQATPLAINGVLEKMYFDLLHFDDFYNSLSIAGVDGTLRGRLMGTAAENNFRGKTGSLNGVSGLAGYLMDPNGDDLIITIIFEFNKSGWGYYRDVQDQIIQLLAEWNKENSDQ